MKKIFALILIILILSLSGCSNKIDLYETGIDITTTMEILTKDATFNENMLGSDSYEVCKDFAVNDYDSPIKVYSISKHDIEKVFNLIINDAESLTSEGEEQIKNIINDYSYVLNLIQLKNISNNFEYLRYISSFKCNKVYEKKRIDEECSYLYVFETGKPILVHYKQVGDDVYVTGSFLILEDTTLSGLREVFEVYGCKVEVVK